MDNCRYDIAVIGGGIVGLASALAIAERAPHAKLAVLEKESRPAEHQTGHNSGVIHSGIYYRPGSQKARLCVEGARLMERFCGDHGLRIERRGKVIVATAEEELPRLMDLHSRGVANGVPGLEVIGPERLREIEPHAAGLRAIHSPSTSTVDYREVASALAADLAARGVTVRVAARVTAIRRVGEDLELATARGAVRARRLLNCAGLHSDTVARLAGVAPDVRIIPFRGEYYRLRRERRDLVRGLIYPVPDPEFPFLGVHFTRSVQGDVEAGPNAVLAFAREGYHLTTIHPGDLAATLAYRGFWNLLRRYWRTASSEMLRSLSRHAFARSLQRLVPEVQPSDLVPGGSGVRAQAVSPDGSLVDDFRITVTADAVHVLNAPSPAATASLAIGRHIASLAVEAFSLV